MDLNQMLAELRSEREQIEAAIIALERLAQGSGRRRGRPPKWMANSDHDDEIEIESKKKPRKFSPEARKRMAEAQKRRWAAQRGEQE